MKDLLSDDMIFKRSRIGDHDTEAECNKSTPWKQAWHQLLGIAGLLYVYHKHTYGQDKKSRIVYYKKRIVHICPVFKIMDKGHYTPCPYISIYKKYSKNNGWLTLGGYIIIHNGRSWSIVMMCIYRNSFKIRYNADVSKWS